MSLKQFDEQDRFRGSSIGGGIGSCFMIWSQCITIS